MPPGRADLLANAIERLISAPTFAQRLVNEAEQKVHFDFNLRVTSMRLAAVFKEFLGERRPASFEPRMRRRETQDEHPQDTAESIHHAREGTA